VSLQFGTWNFSDQRVADESIRKFRTTLAQYLPSRVESYSQHGISILYGTFYTTAESRRETQPFPHISDLVVSFDGCLDNRSELLRELGTNMPNDSTDTAIVAAAYEKWDINSLPKLIGDWALSIWNAKLRELVLAKDVIGTRHLYYAIDREKVAWSTILDPLVRFLDKAFSLCEEYIAGWFAEFPSVHLTPYLGIRAVPPASYVIIRPRTQVVIKYWDFDPERSIRYRTDEEYEERFRSVFARAVQRKLRSDGPILAELSGGMDSAAIVCVADILIARGEVETPRLDTISWYDDSYDSIEPDWNEFHYFSKVEEKRGRVGFHLNLRQLQEKTASLEEPFDSIPSSNVLAAVPILRPRIPDFLKRYAMHVRSGGYRVVLSGIGGGEVAGDGIPDPAPELQNLLAQARLVIFLRQLNAWAEKTGRSRFSILRDALRDFLPPLRTNQNVAPWLHPEFVRPNRRALSRQSPRLKLFGPLPSFQRCIHNLESTRRFLGHYCMQADAIRETRYPYLDRDFLEFMYAIPREQIVRLGQRRSLMKRALVGIIPQEILSRRRKAFVPPATTSASATWLDLASKTEQLLSSSFGILDQAQFLAASQANRFNSHDTISYRVQTLEAWLRHVVAQGLLSDPDRNVNQIGFSLKTSVVGRPKSSVS